MFDLVGFKYDARIKSLDSCTCSIFALVVLNRGSQQKKDFLKMVPSAWCNFFFFFFHFRKIPERKPLQKLGRDLLSHVGILGIEDMIKRTSCTIG